MSLRALFVTIFISCFVVYESTSRNLSVYSHEEFEGNISQPILRKKRHGYPSVLIPLPSPAPISYVSPAYPYPVPSPAPISYVSPAYPYPVPSPAPYYPPPVRYDPPIPQVQIAQPPPIRPIVQIAQPPPIRPIVQIAQPPPIQPQPQVPLPADSEPQVADSEQSPSLTQMMVPKSGSESQSKNTKYPLPGCYTGKSGFMCCSCSLEGLLEKSFDELRKEEGQDWNSANIQQIANRVQRNSETMFGEDFEVVVGLSDLAVKAHFYKDLVCKVQIENRYIVSWASANNETDYYEEGKSGFASMSPSQSSKNCDPQTSANINRELFSQTINPYYQNKYTSIADRENNLAFVWRY